MTIEKIKLIMPPPSILNEVPLNPEWNSIEFDLIELPDEYKKFINIYGTGEIDFFLSIFNPFSNNDYLNLKIQADCILNDLKDLSECLDSFKLLKLFPLAGGILPFAATANGDQLFWETVGDANDWTVSILPTRTADLERTNLTFGVFLYRLLKREVRFTSFPTGFPSERPEFRV